MAYTDPKVILKLSEPDPEIAAFLKAHPMPQTDWENTSALRATMDAVEQAGLAASPRPDDVLEEIKEIPMRDGFMSAIKIHRPASPPSGGSPLIQLHHSGGFSCGTMHQDTLTARAFVQMFGAVVVTISYRLAPEHKFPMAAYDAWDSLKWSADHASELGADPSKGFVIGGISAGGNLTAVLTQMAQEEKLKYPLTGQWLSIPILLHEDIVPKEYESRYLARKQNTEGPLLTSDDLNTIERISAVDVKSPWYSPFNSKKPLSSLPPTLLQVCGSDPLRDDGLIYEDMLRNAGVKTKLEVYPGVPHNIFAFLPMLEGSKKARLDAMLGMGWLLGKHISAQDVSKAKAPVDIAPAAT